MGTPDIDFYRDVFIHKDFQHPDIDLHMKHFPYPVTSTIARIIEAKGALTSIHTACASSGQALGEAFEQVAPSANRRAARMAPG